MTKDRLADLIKAQDKQTTNDVKVTINTQVDQNGVDLKKTFERAEVIGQWIEGVERNVETIRHYLRQLISPNFTELTYKLEDLFQNNTSIFHKINGKLKELEEEVTRSDNESAEGRIKSIQYNTLRTRYMKVFKKNSEELENFKNIQKSNLEAQLIAKGVRVTDEELVALLDNKTDIQVFTDNILAETQEAKRILADIEERHQQLLKIESMLVEVRDLFLQMAILVDTQQDLIDRVDYQAELAREFVGKTPRILDNASKKKRKYLKCKIIIGIVIVLFFILLLVSLFK
ncbi:syntaxin-1A-like [Diorhabda sublineata]|uniref:syntaxin-1A-like n=1 Tax=Diorhabda sublineata TaxID=1163346 RepID=UPI0024E09CD7|nr:syntaxin-1A-like [Diorhabda sublineata]